MANVLTKSLRLSPGSEVVLTLIRDGGVSPGTMTDSIRRSPFSINSKLSSS